MDGAVCRNLHTKAQEETKALRALEPGGVGDDEGTALALILSLAGRIRALQAAVVELSGGAKGIWEQRTSWLHQELLALTTERLRPRTPGGEVSWEAIVRLVYACADNVRAAEAGKSAAEAAAQKEKTALAEAYARVTAAEERAAGAAAAAGEAAESSASREVLELRTKAVVQQQELQRRAADVRELQQRLQAVTHERDQLSQQILLNGGGAGGTGGAGGGGALSSSAATASSSDGGGLNNNHNNAAVEQARLQQARVAEEGKKLLEANHVLSVNLRQHAEVVEKLIGLNAELMDKANEERAGRDPEVIAGRAGYDKASQGGETRTGAVAGPGAVAAGGTQPETGPGPGPVGVSINGGGVDNITTSSTAAGEHEEQNSNVLLHKKPAGGGGWGKNTVSKAWEFLAGDAPPVTPLVNTILNDVPPV